jgi:hypothetical protein
VYEYCATSQYLCPQLNAYYLETPVTSITIPEKYAAKILYADCMIDTTQNIYFPNARSDRDIQSHKRGQKYGEFIGYVNNNTFDSNRHNFYYYGIRASDTCVRNRLSLQPQFKKLLGEAAEEALQNDYKTSDWFEDMAGEYYSKKMELALRRSHKAVGFCSRDSGPRKHLFSIALLAAETANWQVFLRAHLDIMNDRVDRMADANSEWGRRLTYIKELEDLDINVYELMLAICFVIDNPASNHYLGSIDRLGRAFAEAKDRTKLEQEILTMIEDNELDDLNRLRMHYLFLNYIYNLPKKQDRATALSKLEAADKKLPFYIYSKLEINKEDMIGKDDKE